MIATGPERRAAQRAIAKMIDRARNAAAKMVGELPDNPVRAAISATWANVHLRDALVLLEQFTGLTFDLDAFDDLAEKAEPDMSGCICAPGAELDCPAAVCPRRASTS